MATRKPRGKREPKPERKPRAHVTTSYEMWKAEWERRKDDLDRGAGDWLVDKPELEMDAAAFLTTLRRLGFVRQDNRYFDLYGDLMNSGMVDPASGKWSRYGTVLANPDTQMICEAIEAGIAAGLSERDALAEIAVEFNIEAASFDAAVKRLRQLLHEHRKRFD